MASPRDIRRLAMQVLYQMDLGSNPDAFDIGADLDDEHGEPEVRRSAVSLAAAAWSSHDRADALINELAPRWPTSRQPAVDRAILRLAYHELASGRVPVRVAINEAVELAKAFGTAESGAFVNGVVDRMARRLAEQSKACADQGTLAGGGAGRDGETPASGGTASPGAAD